MTAAKHTPGPWSQGRLLITAVTSRWSESQRRGADEEERCMVFANFTSADEGRSRQLVASCVTEENARLIAAAPDLLKSLIEITGVLDTLLMVKSEPEPGSIGGRARDAIAKATGGAE